MAMQTNYDHLLSLGVYRMAVVIWNLCDDYCAFCPLNMEQRCRNNCAAGIRAWLTAPYIPESKVWKESKK